jgi:hypothetical protein
LDRATADYSGIHTLLDGTIEENMDTKRKIKENDGNKKQGSSPFTISNWLYNPHVAGTSNRPGIATPSATIHALLDQGGGDDAEKQIVVKRTRRMAETHHQQSLYKFQKYRYRISSKIAAGRYFFQYLFFEKIVEQKCH